MFDESVRQEIMNEYNVDIIDDVFYKNDHHLIFCFDWTKRLDAELKILHGDIEQLGVPKGKYTIEQIFRFFEINNPISEIFGKDKYFETMIMDLDNLDENNEVFLPVKKKSGVLWVVCSLKALTKKDGVNELVCGRVNWVSEIQPKAIQYYENTYKDPLTNLFTKEALKVHLSRVRSTDHSFGIYFDIDNFKRINDIFGHRAGDRYLKDLGDKFISVWEEDVVYYRIGGDEFFVYLINSTEEEVYRRALQIIYDVESLNSEGQQVEVSASIGIVPIIGSDFDVDLLIDLADRAMYHSKSKGKGNISFARDV